jgi:putative Holliday junction resolvase
VRGSLGLRYTPCRRRVCNLPREFIQNEESRKGFGEPGRVLALDLGTKRVGVAVSDESRLSVRTLPALARTSWKRLLKAVAELCESFDVKMVVLGLPLRLDGSEGDSASEARRIARNLELSLKLPVKLQDERFTSKAAETSLRSRGYQDEQVAEKVDSEAAAIILNDFLSESETDTHSEHRL